MANLENFPPIFCLTIDFFWGGGANPCKIFTSEFYILNVLGFVGFGLMQAILLFSPLDLSLVEMIQAILLSYLDFWHIDYRQTN